MRTEIPEKLLAIADEIDAYGSANLTRLTVIKKWFEHPGRLPAFGLWIAKRAAGRKGKTKAEADALLGEARALLGLEYRVYAALLLDVGSSNGWKSTDCITRDTPP